MGALPAAAVLLVLVGAPVAEGDPGGTASAARPFFRERGSRPDYPRFVRGARISVSPQAAAAMAAAGAAAAGGGQMRFAGAAAAGGKPGVDPTARLPYRNKFFFGGSGGTPFVYGGQHNYPGSVPVPMPFGGSSNENDISHDDLYWSYGRRSRPPYGRFGGQRPKTSTYDPFPLWYDPRDPYGPMPNAGTFNFTVGARRTPISGRCLPDPKQCPAERAGSRAPH